jgi:hypothetical protein
MENGKKSKEGRQEKKKERGLRYNIRKARRKKERKKERSFPSVFCFHAEQINPSSFLICMCVFFAK